MQRAIIFGINRQLRNVIDSLPCTFKLANIKTRLSWLFVFIITLCLNPLKASHLAGADISYQHLGGDTYKIVVNLFRDCSGIDYVFNSSNVLITSDCGHTVSANWTQVNIPSNLPYSGSGTEISSLCSSLLPYSTCNLGNLGTQVGTVKFTYEAVVGLSPSCSTWTIGYQPPCCRNSIVNSNAGQLYVQALLSAPLTQANNSAVFENPPVQQFCLGQSVCAYFGATDADGDSLVYSIVPGFQTPILNISYLNNNPFTGLPLNGYTASPAIIDSATGELCFIPTALGNFVVVVQVQEYRNGILVGTVMRDAQFVVLPCSSGGSSVNARPTSTGHISGFTGSAIQTNANTIHACLGDNFSFHVTFSDSDIGDSLRISTNIASVLPGATYTVSYPNAPTSYDSAVVSVNWTVSSVSAGIFNFFIEASDGVCFPPGHYNTIFFINILNSTYAGPDLSICQFVDSAQIQVEGGSQFQWSSISGSPLITTGPNANFSCDTCSQVWATPNVSTRYLVVSNLTSGCINVDTVYVRVATDYSIAITSDTTLCKPDSVVFSVLPNNPQLNYNFNWKNELNGLNYSSIQPKMFIQQPTNINVRVESDSGCVKSGSIAVDFANPFPSNFRILSSDTNICRHDTVVLEVEADGIDVLSCGIAEENCIGIEQNYQVGTGVQINDPYRSGPAGFPTPFNGRHRCARQQFLYRASDLQAAGVPAGQITAIAFDVVQLGSHTVLNNYEVKIKCTTKNALNSALVNGNTPFFENNLETVRYAAPLPLTVGLNTINFDEPYNWDGISNIVIELSGVNPGFQSIPSTSHSAVVFRSTNYASSSHWAGNDCSNATRQGSSSPLNRVPVIVFTVCSGVNYQALDYQWSFANNNGLFSGSLNSQQIQAVLNLQSDRIVKVVVADSFGACRDSAFINFNIQPQLSINMPQALGPYCIDDPIVNLDPLTSSNLWHGPEQGLWQGSGITNTTKGRWRPKVAGLGTSWVYFTLHVDSCVATDSISLTVLPPPDPTILSINDSCTQLNPIQLTSVSAGGRWYSPNVPSTVDSSGQFFTDGYGGVPITLVHLTRLNSCNATDTVVFLAPERFIADIQGVSPVCENDPPFQILNRGQSGGVWSGVANNADIFDPSKAALGTLTYVYLDSIGYCGASDSIGILVIESPNVNLGNDTILPSSYSSITLDPGQWSNYLWDNGSKMRYRTVSQTGVYSVTVSGLLQCKGADSIQITLPYPVGMKAESNSSSAYMLFPNPSSGLIFLQPLAQSIQPKAVRIEIYNYHSQKVYSAEHIISNEGIEIDASSLPSGLYLVVITSDESTDRLRLILNK